MRKKPEITPPESLTHQPLEIVEQKRKYELITPLYGGGVTTDKDNPTITDKADPITVVRATEVRGQLRFWWRAIRGGHTEGETSLKKREDAIWGKAYEKGDKGIGLDQTVQIVVDIVHEGLSIKPFFMERGRPKPANGIPAYVAFPLQPDQDKRRQGDPPITDVRKGVQFLLTIVYPDNLSKEIEAALWAWETFGGLGARTRRGFGVLHLLESEIIPPKNPPLPEVPPTSRNVEDWIRDKIFEHLKDGAFPRGLPHFTNAMQLVVTAPDTSMRAWDTLISKLQKFRQRKDESRPDARFEKEYNKRSAWPEADTIREIAGKGSVLTMKKFPRAAFGLPIIFHFTGKNAPAGNYTLNEVDTEHERKPGEDLPHRERFASPLILRPFQCSDGKAVGLALLLEGSRVDLKQLALQPPPNERKQTQSVEGTLNSTEAHTLTKKVPELNDETDVLQAFMKFLKKG
jgi:CRISPR-associated protein Cmr1